MISIHNQNTIGSNKMSQNWKNSLKTSTKLKFEQKNIQLERQLKQIISSLEAKELNNLFKCFQIQNNNVAIRNFKRSNNKCVECQLIYNIKLEQNCKNNNIIPITAKGFGRSQQQAQNHAMRNLLQTFVCKGIKIQTILKALRGSKYKQPLIKYNKEQNIFCQFQRPKDLHIKNKEQSTNEKNNINLNKVFSTKCKRQNFYHYNGSSEDQLLKVNKENIYNSNQIVSDSTQLDNQNIKTSQLKSSDHKKHDPQNRQRKRLLYSDIFETEQISMSDKSNFKQSSAKQCKKTKNQQDIQDNTLILDDIDCCFTQNRAKFQTEQEIIDDLQSQLQSSDRTQIQNKSMNSIQRKFQEKERSLQQEYQNWKNTENEQQKQNIYKQINKQNMKQIKNLMARIKLLEQQNVILKELLLKQHKIFGKSKSEYNFHQQIN